MDSAPPSLAAPFNTIRQPRYVAWHRGGAVRALASSIVVGVLIDQVLHTSLVGLAGSVTTVAAGVGLLVSRTRTPGRVMWVSLAIGLSPWLSLRTSPWLIGPTVAALAGLLTLAASPDGTRLVSFPGLARQGATVLAATVDSPLQAFRAAATLAPPDAEQQIRRSLFGIAIAASVGFLLLVLLVSGDAYFASIIGVQSLGMRLFDMIAVAFGALAWLSLVVAGRRSAPPNLPATGMPASIGTREVAFVLGGVLIVLGGYVTSLLAGALGGAAYIERRTGLTYAEYARSGFFQLVAVVAIVSSLLIACRTVVKTSLHRQGLLTAALAICTLTLVMVAVSIARLQTYRSVFGLTMLRFSTTVFAAWLGIVIVLIGLTLIKTRWQPSLVVAVVLSAYATLMVTNWINPESIVTRENIENIDWVRGTTRSAGGAEFDTTYLATQLSDDAVPTLVERLNVLPAEQRSALVHYLCGRSARGDGWSWNRARSQAERALATICDA